MDLASALLAIHPAAVFSIYDNDYARIEWAEGNPPLPTLAECEAAWDALVVARNAESSNDLTLRQQAEQALDSLRAYRDAASPTNAQTVAAVKLLCRVCIGLIRLALRKLDGLE